MHLPGTCHNVLKSYVEDEETIFTKPEEMTVLVTQRKRTTSYTGVIRFAAGIDTQIRSSLI